MKRSTGLRIVVLLASLVFLGVIIGQMCLTSNNCISSWNYTLHFIMGVIAGIAMVLTLIGCIKIKNENLEL